MTPAGIGPATFRFVAQDLNHCATAVPPPLFLYVMEGGNEQRVAIKFCLKAYLSATETLVLVQWVRGNEAPNGSNVFRWYS